MEFKNPFKSKIEHLLSKEAEYQLYKKAADDIEANIIDKGIWTKAYALANGDEKKQKVRYIDLIVEHYKDLIKAGEELETILKTEAEKEEAEKQKEEKQRYKNDYQQEQEVKNKENEQQDLPERDMKPEEANGNALFILIVFALIITIAAAAGGFL